MTTEITVFERGVCLKWHYMKPKYFLPIDYALYYDAYDHISIQHEELLAKKTLLFFAANFFLNHTIIVIVNFALSHSKRMNIYLLFFSKFNK